MFLAIGFIGMGIILSAYYAEQTGRLKKTDLWYDFLNLAGSSMLVAYAWSGRVWPFLILNGVWALFSLKEVVYDLAHSKIV